MICFFVSCFLLQNELPEQRKYMKRMAPSKALAYLLQHPTEYVFVAPQEVVDAAIRIHFWDGQGENPFHFSPPIGDVPVLPTGLLKRGSPYNEIFSRKAQALLAAGIINGKFKPDSIKMLRQRKKSEEVEKKTITVGLRYLSTYLWICLGLLILSVLVFLMELCAPYVIWAVILWRGS